MRQGFFLLASISGRSDLCGLQLIEEFGKILAMLPCGASHPV
jgi:hypothetical protein